MFKMLNLALLILCLVCTTAFAGGSGNCAQPLRTTTEYLGAGGAFEYNYVHKRLNDMDNKWGPKSMKVENVSQVYGKVIIGLYDNFNIYGKIGGCGYDLEFVDKAQDARMVVDLKNGLYTGAGINGLYPMAEAGGLSFGIGFDVQGNFFYNDVKDITRSGQAATSVDGAFFGLDGENSIYLTCKYNIDILQTSIVPYIGGYHSWILIGTISALSYETPLAGYVEREHFQPAFDLASFGLLLGVDLDIAKYVNLNVEGRFIGETAITTGATIKF